MLQPQRIQREDLAGPGVAGKVVRGLAVRLLLLGAVLLPSFPTQAQSTPEVTTRVRIHGVAAPATPAGQPAGHATSQT